MTLLTYSLTESILKHQHVVKQMHNNNNYTCIGLSGNGLTD